jgi:uncharacterized protein (TIGR02217 family)
MSGVVNEVFAPPLGFQTSGGPVWQTSIVPLASGSETRNARRARPLRRWSVVGVPVSRGDAEELIRFFNARSGAFQGFRFRDPFTSQSAETITPFDQQIGTGDGVTTPFQLVLDDGASALRTITRPVTGSVRVAVDGVESEAFTVDDTTGVVTFTVPPANGAVITAGFSFDTPVRFDQDTLEISQTSTGAFQLVRLTLIELQEGVNA